MALRWQFQSPGLVLLVLLFSAKSAAGGPNAVDQSHATQPQPHQLQIATSLSQSEFASQIEQQLRRAYGRLGYQMQVVRLPAGRSLQMTNRGVYDGELFRIDGIQQEFTALRQVPVELARIELLAFVRSTQLQNLRQWPLQKQLRIGYVRGFRLASQMQFAGHAVPVTTLEQAVGMLEQGKIDVLLEDRLSVLTVLPEKTEQAGISALPGVLASAGIYHYLHQRHSDLLQPLATVLKKSRAAGKDKRPLPRPEQSGPVDD